MNKILSGFQGKKDAMRESAEKLLRGEMKGKSQPLYSASAIGNTKVRPYKKGGKVHVHKMNKEQKDLHITKRAKTPKFKEELVSKVQPYKKGGKACMVLSHGGEAKMKSQSVYEKQMTGNRPSSKRHHFNYEAEMGGEKPSRRRNFAIGGSGKVRHHEATKKGNPMRAKRLRSH